MINVVVDNNDNECNVHLSAACLLSVDTKDFINFPLFFS